MSECQGLSLSVDLNLRSWPLAATGLLAACGSPDTSPTLIVRGGSILTVNDQDECAQAMAIRDGLIVAIGSEAEELALKGPRTEMIELTGRVVLPGLIAETRAIAPFITDLKSPLKLFGRYEAALDGDLAQGFTSVASLS